MIAKGHKWQPYLNLTDQDAAEAWAEENAHLNDADFINKLRTEVMSPTIDELISEIPES